MQSKRTGPFRASKAFLQRSGIVAEAAAAGLNERCRVTSRPLRLVVRVAEGESPRSLGGCQVTKVTAIFMNQL